MFLVENQILLYLFTRLKENAQFIIRLLTITFSPARKYLTIWSTAAPSVIISATILYVLAVCPLLKDHSKLEHGQNV